MFQKHIRKIHQDTSSKAIAHQHHVARTTEVDSGGIAPSNNHLSFEFLKMTSFDSSSSSTTVATGMNKMHANMGGGSQNHKTMKAVQKDEKLILDSMIKEFGSDDVSRLWNQVKIGAPPQKQGVNNQQVGTRDSTSGIVSTPASSGGSTAINNSSNKFLISNLLK